MIYFVLIQLIRDLLGFQGKEAGDGNDRNDEEREQPYFR
jgi:hypothetical protein